MTGRTIAIGDIHGCPDALAALIDAVAPGRDDTIVTLGDYIDRGPNSRGVLDRLLRLAGQCRLVPLLGNHEEALLDALQEKDALRRWLTLGGAGTLRSYGGAPRGAPRGPGGWGSQSRPPSSSPPGGATTKRRPPCSPTPAPPLNCRSASSRRWRCGGG